MSILVLNGQDGIEEWLATLDPLKSHQCPGCTKMVTVAQAINQCWEPTFVNLDDEEVDKPICPSCVNTFCSWDEEDGLAIQTKPFPTPS